MRDDLSLVLEFLNTLDVEEGTDQLTSVAGWEEWLRAHDLPSAPRTRIRAVELRQTLRAAVSGTQAAPLPVSVTVTIDDEGRPALSASGPVGRIAAAAATLGIDGRWERLKICPAVDCRWAFYDKSRNRSRQWCSMAVCGARAKSRQFRARHSPR